jgi:NAD(P)-dependent dehydrogenase (short-subunit alcohol dehydrogenase family)
MYTVRPNLSTPYKLLLALRAQRLSSTNRHTLKGKKSVITGASRGIGLAIARRFACEGADTILIGRDENTLQKAVENVKSGCGGVGSHVARVGNVSQRQFWEGLQRELVSFILYHRLPKTLTKYASAINQKAVDILVNAAGISHSTFLVLTNAELADQIIQTNLMGTLWGCQVLVRGMIKQRSGRFYMRR